MANVEITADHVGRRVFVEGHGSGTVQYVGPVHKKGFMRKSSQSGPTKCGVALDEANGSSDGVFKGHQYFTCEENHGMLVSPKRITLLRPEARRPSAVATAAATAAAKDRLQSQSIYTNRSVAAAAASPAADFDLLTSTMQNIRTVPVTTQMAGTRALLVNAVQQKRDSGPRILTAALSPRLKDANKDKATPSGNERGRSSRSPDVFDVAKRGSESPTRARRYNTQPSQNRFSRRLSASSDEGAGAAKPRSASPSIIAAMQSHRASVGSIGEDSDEELVTGFETDDLASSSDEDVDAWMMDLAAHDRDRESTFGFPDLEGAAPEGLGGNRLSKVINQENTDRSQLRNEMLHMLEVQKEENMQAEKDAIANAARKKHREAQEAEVAAAKLRNSSKKISPGRAGKGKEPGANRRRSKSPPTYVNNLTDKFVRRFSIETPPAKAPEVRERPVSPEEQIQQKKPAGLSSAEKTEVARKRLEKLYKSS